MHCIVIKYVFSLNRRDNAVIRSIFADTAVYLRCALYFHSRMVILPRDFFITIGS